jgi:hypothetical protein
MYNELTPYEDWQLENKGYIIPARENPLEAEEFEREPTEDHLRWLEKMERKLNQ